MTVSSNHPINLEGLQALITALKGGKRGSKKFFLYFVVPPERFDDFKIQKLVSPANEDIGISVRQYALKIDFAPIVHPDWRLERDSHLLSPDTSDKRGRGRKAKSSDVGAKSSLNAPDNLSSRSKKASKMLYLRGEEETGESAETTRAMGSVQHPQRKPSQPLLAPRKFLSRIRHISNRQMFLRPSAGFKI